MQKISRSAAIHYRFPKYFTGISCKHGHIAARYTKSGACCECVHPKFECAIDPTTHARQRARVIMKHARFELHPDDLDYFGAMVHASSLVQEPLLQRRDILTRRRPEPRQRPYMVYTFWVFDEDRRDLYELQNSLLAERQSALPECAHEWVSAATPEAPLKLGCQKCNITS